MKYRRIKKVNSKSGKPFYYLGDGLWFGRISEAKAKDGLARGEYVYWEDKSFSFVK